MTQTIERKPSDHDTVPIQLSVVIPMYNEERNVGALFERLLAVCRTLPFTWEVVCVDDGSRDHTAKLVRMAQAKAPEIVLVRFARNFGQHAAVTAGFAHARGAWIITLDADLQNPPEEIPKLVGCFTAGHDLVNTWRIDRQDTWFRKTASRYTNQVVRRISGIKLEDFGCMLRGYSREVAQAVVNCREYKTFIPALASLFARDPTSIGVAHAERAAGISNYSLLKLLSLQLDLVTSFSVYPLRLLFLVGSLLAIAGVLFGSLLLGMRLANGPAWANDGTLTVLGILMIFTGFQFLALGLLGEYIGRIFQQVRLREPFIVQSVERTRPDADVAATSAETPVSA
jgi:undecaprenyl-phosphate 4-deoxy-4-formamido-L-arabinose transferase